MQEYDRADLYTADRELDIQARQEEIAALQARVIELGRENALLKRAVTIQQSRLQEGDAASKQQATQAEAVIADLQVVLMPYSLTKTAYMVLENS